MSGAGIQCCRICGHALKLQADYGEGVVLEREEWCDGCELYNHRFVYGLTMERIGVIESSWDHDESPPKNWREQEAEARRIWGSETARGLVQAMRDNPDDVTPPRVLADWCEDNECPLSAAHLRDGRP